MSVKVPLPEESELTDRLKEELASLPQLNVMRAMANTPASFQAFLMLGRSILFESEFDPRKREIAVLRVAHLTRAHYEWQHHVILGQEVGLTRYEVKKISMDGPVTGLDEEGNLLCRVAEEITCQVRLSDDALQQILDRYGKRGAAELILCCSYFNMVSRFLESNRVEMENSITASS